MFDERLPENLSFYNLKKTFGKVYHVGNIYIEKNFYHFFEYKLPNIVNAK